MLRSADTRPNKRMQRNLNRTQKLDVTEHFSSFRSFGSMFLVTASQVILGIALIMGISALVTVMLRVCSSRRYPRSGQNLSNVPDEFGRVGGTRVSVTSLQQRVMTKMRDRPPRYETRHNYEYQRREGCTRIPILNPAASVAASEASIPPPAYENSDNNSVRGEEVVTHGNLIYKFVLEGE